MDEKATILAGANQLQSLCRSTIAHNRTLRPFGEIDVRQYRLRKCGRLGGGQAKKISGKMECRQD